MRNVLFQVNKDFGNIFSTLLPGATAKLSPQEGQSVLDGLEFRVGFGDVWKENLSELSGGQRSLLALSLILAMLLLKPAPIYILDEVRCPCGFWHCSKDACSDHFGVFKSVGISPGPYQQPLYHKFEWARKSCCCCPLAYFLYKFPISPIFYSLWCTSARYRCIYDYEASGGHCRLVSPAQSGHVKLVRGPTVWLCGETNISPVQPYINYLFETATNVIFRY